MTPAAGNRDRRIASFQTEAAANGNARLETRKVACSLRNRRHRRGLRSVGSTINRTCFGSAPGSLVLCIWDYAR